MPLDPEKLRKSLEALDATPEKGSRSYLAEVETQVLALLAKKHTYRYIRKWLLEHLDLRVPLTTLWEFAKAAKVRGTKNKASGVSKTGRTAEAGRRTYAPRKALLGHEVEDPRPNFSRAAHEQTWEDKQASDNLDFDPSAPLIPNPEKQV